MVIYKKLIVLLLIVSQVHQGNIMEKDRELMNTNPNLINIYLDALKMKESSNNYLAQHSPSTIEDLATGKPISVRALGAYGILDINWSVWSKQAGLEGADPDIEVDDSDTDSDFSGFSGDNARGLADLDENTGIEDLAISGKSAHTSRGFSGATLDMNNFDY